MCLTSHEFPLKANTESEDRMKTNATKAGGAKINEMLKYNLNSVGINVHCTHLGIKNVSVCLLTSLQSVFSDRTAVAAQASSSEGSHLDLVLSPDDQIFQQAVVGLWAADVLLLVVPWQTCQTVPTAHKHKSHTE